MKFKTLILLIITVGMFSCKQKVTEVIICSSIHGLHKSNTNYSYNDLFEYIERFDPELIGVEIRQEDIDSSNTYLKNYYPYEMYKIIKRNKAKTIYGLDWLGASIEGKPIPKNYFKELDIIKTQKIADGDSIFQASLGEIHTLGDLKNEIASSSTMKELNSGRYDSLNSIYYEKFNHLYSNSPYSNLEVFYKKRDLYITNRMMEIISNNRGKRMIFILGADHRSRAIESFMEKFKDDSSIRLIDIL